MKIASTTSLDHYDISSCVTWAVSGIRNGYCGSRENNLNNPLTFKAGHFGKIANVGVGTGSLTL
jgi:hypothetical protein